MSNWQIVIDIPSELEDLAMELWGNQEWLQDMLEQDNVTEAALTVQRLKVNSLISQWKEQAPGLPVPGEMNMRRHRADPDEQESTPAQAWLDYLDI